MHDYYEILGVSKDASADAIKKAFRVRALREHPDKGGESWRMALLNEAYVTLSDLVERKRFEDARQLYYACYDIERPLILIITERPLLDALPTAGIAYSKIFQQRHEQLVKQYCLEPLGQHQSSSSCLKAFSSDLYPCDGGDLFSFLRSKGNHASTLDIGLLSPEKAVEHFINFLKGDYSGNNLIDISKAFYRKIKSVETAGQQAGCEFQLYSGIYEIFLVAAKERTPTAKILFSLQKITEYAKNNVDDETIKLMAPLLQSKYFRSLFSQALHCYWLSDESDELLGQSYTEAFDGQAATKTLIERSKSKLSENRIDRESNMQKLRSAVLLLKLEEDLRKSTKVPTAGCHRKIAFHLLDWLPAVAKFDGYAITVNTFLQIGMRLQKAAAHECNPAVRVADEKLAVQIYEMAVDISRHAKPDLELYAYVHSVKLLLSCRYADSKLKETLVALQARALWIADLFPFFDAPQSNADFHLKGDSRSLRLMRKLLHALVAQIEDRRGIPADIGHSCLRVFYQAYEACLKHWYQDNYDGEREATFRRRLMQELLASKQWTIDNLDRNLKSPWPLDDLDEQGWTRSKASLLPSAQQINATTYKTIHGVEFDVDGSGDISFILDYCEESESEDQCLLTSFDLGELIQRRLIAAQFSLDPVDPDMPYHPFNQMYFKPSSLHYSQLLHAMFIADYLLKFLTTGREVQRRDPYDLRSLDELVSRLPDHLKKVIYDFHASNGGYPRVHRFWIDADHVECAEERGEDGKMLFALGNIRMVVKQKKMELDAEGKLVDKDGEDEGWDCYVLNQEQEQELYDGTRIVQGSALIVLEYSWELIFWENQRVTCRFTLAECQQDLILLSKLPRDQQQKVNNDSTESLRQIYEIVTKAADKNRIPHGFSPEFIFAQEFTKYYNEFAIHFPEFGRLRELSKAVTVIQIMTQVREWNLKEIDFINRKLDYYKKSDGIKYAVNGEDEIIKYWLETLEELTELVKEHVTKRFEQLKKEIEECQDKILDELRRQIGTLNFTRKSPEIKKICDRFYNDYRSNYIDAYGILSWIWYSTFTCNVYKEIINPQIPNLIKSLGNQKREQCYEELLKLFSEKFDELPRPLISDSIEMFLDGNDEPLRRHLVIHERKQIVKKLKEVYPEQTLQTIDDALNQCSRAINTIVLCERQKQLEAIKQHLNDKLIVREKLEESFVDLNFGVDSEELDLEAKCLWVPASFYRDVGGTNSRTVYGGVSICPEVRSCIRDADRAALLKQTQLAGKRLQENRLSGNAASAYFAKNITAKYHDCSEYKTKEQFYFNTPEGRRFLDVVVIDKRGNIVKAYEIKTGKSNDINKIRKSYKGRQKRVDKWLYDNEKILTPVKLVALRFRIPFESLDKEAPLSDVSISKALRNSHSQRR